MVKCKITLERSGQTSYYPGETVKGTVEVTVEQSKKFRALRVTLYGAAECEWIETSERTVGTGNDRRTETEATTYKGAKVYVNERKYLFGNENSQPILISGGVHNDNFEFDLPNSVPASFEAKQGFIRYYVEAVLEETWGVNINSKQQFSVVRSDDLNDHPDLKLPVTDEEMRTFCCLFCESEPLIVTLALPCTGFTAGQDIPITISYVNKSDVKVESTIIYLNRYVQYRSTTPANRTIVTVDKLLEVLEGGVTKASSKTIQRVLKLPNSLINSNGRLCSVLEISYNLEVETHISGCRSSIKFNSPIVIGSVPLNMNQAHAVPQESFNGIALSFSPLNVNSMVAGASMNPHASNPNHYLPSFDETLKMSNNEQWNGMEAPPMFSVISAQPTAPSAPLYEGSNNFGTRY